MANLWIGSPSEWQAPGRHLTIAYNFTYNVFINMYGM